MEGLAPYLDFEVKVVLRMASNQKSANYKNMWHEVSYLAILEKKIK